MAKFLRGVLAMTLFTAMVGFFSPQALACEEGNVAPKKKAGSDSQLTTGSADVSTTAPPSTGEATDAAKHHHEIKLQVKEEDGKISKIECSEKVACLHPNAACPESEKVIETLKTLASHYTEGNFEELSKFMDKDVTTFDDKTKKLIVGKDAVMEDIKKRWTAAHDEGRPVLSYTINHPYAKVTGDSAVVTFDAIKQVGGKKPEQYLSHCTDVFVKRADGWKKLHYRSSWKKSTKEGT